jgi:signal transduction histidine kinase
VTLERRGLIDALEGLAMQAREAYRVQVEFIHRLPGGVELDRAVADHLYRIAQEALANAMRHGRAKSVRITLTSRGERIRLQVADDGTGLPPDAVAAPGLGLKIMRYRARMVGGEVRFDRNGRRGTRVTCECPVERRAVRLGSGDRRRAPSADQDRRAAGRRTDA